jgi:hypothetical protein
VGPHHQTAIEITRTHIGDAGPISVFEYWFRAVSFKDAMAYTCVSICERMRMCREVASKEVSEQRGKQARGKQRKGSGQRVARRGSSKRDRQRKRTHLSVSSSSSLLSWLDLFHSTLVVDMNRVLRGARS